MNIEELKRLAEAATPGPVAMISKNDAGQISIKNPDGSFFDISKNVGCQFYAAHAPAAILELIQQRDELLAALKACRKELSAWMRHHGEDIATQEAVAQARAAIAKAET